MDHAHRSPLRALALALCILSPALVLLVSSCSLINRDREFKPKGASFALNPGITVSALYGSDTGYSRVGFFNVELRGRSATGQVIVETLPGGLFFIPGSDKTQNLIVIRPQIISFGATETTWVIGSFCCNSGLHTPDGDDVFAIGPVTDNADLKKIIDIVADRDITWYSYLVQSAVWQVTDGTGLTPNTEDSLRNLPPDTTRLDRAPLPDLGQLKRAWRER